MRCLNDAEGSEWVVAITPTYSGCPATHVIARSVIERLAQHGLTRVRGLTMDDSHIYCTPEQMPGELRSLLAFILDLLRDYGLDDFYLELSTRDPAKSIGTEQDWTAATEALRHWSERSPWRVE